MEKFIPSKRKKKKKAELTMDFKTRTVNKRQKVLGNDRIMNPTR